MKGYIYTMYAGADPGRGWHMTDPIFKPRPTLGACMPNIRRLVMPGDQIFVVSGRVKGFQQYIVGGFQVDDKISALAAYERFPEYRQHLLDSGELSGNIIVGADGLQNAFDYHSNFERRIENYIVGSNPIMLESDAEIELGRQESIHILRNLFDRPFAESIFGAIGRFRKIDERQIRDLRKALNAIKSEAKK